MITESKSRAPKFRHVNGDVQARIRKLVDANFGGQAITEKIKKEFGISVFYYTQSRIWLEILEYRSMK